MRRVVIVVALLCAMTSAKADTASSTTTQAPPSVTSGTTGAAFGGTVLFQDIRQISPGTLIPVFELCDGNNVVTCSEPGSPRFPLPVGPNAKGLKVRVKFQPAIVDVKYRYEKGRSLGPETRGLVARIGGREYPIVWSAEFGLSFEFELGDLEPGACLIGIDGEIMAGREYVRASVLFFTATLSAKNGRVGQGIVLNFPAIYFRGTRDPEELFAFQIDNAGWGNFPMGTADARGIYPVYGADPKVMMKRQLMRMAEVQKEIQLALNPPPAAPPAAAVPANELPRAKEGEGQIGRSFDESEESKTSGRKRQVEESDDVKSDDNPTPRTGVGRANESDDTRIRVEPAEKSDEKDKTSPEPIKFWSDKDNVYLKVSDFAVRVSVDFGPGYAQRTRPDKIMDPQGDMKGKTPPAMGWQKVPSLLLIVSWPVDHAEHFRFYGVDGLLKPSDPRVLAWKKLHQGGQQ